MTTVNVFNPLVAAGQSDVVNGGTSTRRIPLTDAKSDLGVPLTVTAVSGAMGITRVAGSSLQLVGEVASAGSNTTDKAFFEIVLPDTYVAGANISAIVDVSVLGSGTVNATATMVSLAAYTYSNGVETAVSVTPTSQQVSGTAVDYTFVINGGSIVSESRMGLETTLVMHPSSGVITGTINKVEYVA
jgi:hypothetical protein